MGIAPFEKCLPVAKRNQVRVMELRTLVPVPYDDHLVPRAQVAPIVYGRREWGYTYTRWRPCAFFFDILIR